MRRLSFLTVSDRPELKFCKIQSFAQLLADFAYCSHQMVPTMHDLGQAYSSLVPCQVSQDYRHENWESSNRISS